MSVNKTGSVENFIWAPSRYDLRNERVLKVVAPTVSGAAVELLEARSFDELIRPHDARGLAPLVEAAQTIAPAIKAEKHSLQILSTLAKQADFEQLLFRLKKTDALLNKELLGKVEVDKTRHSYHVHIRLGRYALGSALRQEYDSTEAARLRQ